MLLHRYDELVRKGLAANPAEAGIAAEPASTPVAEASEGAGCQKQARNLLLRLQRKREEVLRFTTDFHVPFDNNRAERVLRMVKLQQKIGGCFHTEEGARRFCRTRGYISTMRKQGKEVLVAFERACRGKPLSLRRCARLLNSYRELIDRGHGQCNLRRCYFKFVDCREIYGSSSMAAVLRIWNAGVVLERAAFREGFGFFHPSAFYFALRYIRQVRLDVQNGCAVEHVRATYAQDMSLAPEQPHDR